VSLDLSSEIFLPLIIAAFIGLIFGYLISYFILKARSEKLNILFSNEQKKSENLKLELIDLKKTLQELQSEKIILIEDRATLRSEVDQQKKRYEELNTVTSRLEERVGEAFKNLSAEALKSNNQAFLEVASNSLNQLQSAARQDLKSREEAIGLLVKPLQESLQQINQHTQQIEKAREGAYQGLITQVKSLAETQNKLRDETAHLAQSLRTPSVRGRWGEVQLRRVVELAGMVEHCDFSTQVSSHNDNEVQRRPDLLVNLPGNKVVVVDAKTPVEAYLEAVKATDDKEREEQLDRHARHIRTHIKQLGDKAYFNSFENTPEFVVLFLPGECFFSAAVERDPGLIEYGMERQVVVATPTTLIALLRAVAYGWDQAKLSEHAKEVRRLGRELFDRIVGFAKHLDGAGKNLGKAVSGYNQAIGTLESRVLISARRLGELVSKENDALPVNHPIEATPRAISDSNLVEETAVNE
jgi:DNA recombination protein RmuC